MTDTLKLDKVMRRPKDEVTVMKKVAVVAAVLLLAGCASRPSPTLARSGTTESSKNVGAQPVSLKPTDKRVEATSEAAQVLLRFADLVTKGDIQGAANLLAPGLQGVYRFQNYAPLRNTPRMETVRLVERTGDPNWPPDVGARDQKVADTHVFAVDVRYKVLGIIDSSFKDGEIYHHKATVTRYTADGPWLISELSGTGN